MDDEQLARIASADFGVTIVTGFPASGKSTTAQRLAAAVGALLIDKDSFAPDLEEAVMGELVGNPYDRDSETYMRVVNPHIYRAILHQALAAGHHTRVVVDAPFLGHVRAASEAGVSLASHVAAVTEMPAPPIRTVWIATSPDRIRERMTARGASRDLGKLADWSTYQSSVLENGTADAAKSAVDFIIQT
ncbi:AAA family ATPase [Nocardia brasiliensis]|uniref:AAA family ATPase n=1 Tax=Nocardia brasiliensis TaxID=37326 RepID=UPI00245768C7|nr:AAA family ATPase [Nocardia brasiliensis]